MGSSLSVKLSDDKMEEKYILFSKIIEYVRIKIDYLWICFQHSGLREIWSVFSHTDSNPLHTTEVRR